ncbi:MAG: FtsX-like permease family protein [Tannerellaceae bacterium]|jgi:putative ABC transport system permease protein|nr:FtsX-like permease family protein [Tannerellaceae bacterium]
MKTLIIAFRSLFKRKRNNLIKIASLSVGLAVGLTLIAKVYYEQTYDDFFPHAKRIYSIGEMGMIGGQLFEHPLVSGGVAPGFAAEIADVEAATRFTFLANEETFYDKNRKKYKGDFTLADSALFSMFPVRIMSGNPQEILARPLYAMVSRKIADMLGGLDAAVGQSIEMNSAPGRTITIGGVFDNLPHNSHLKFDILVSLKSISNFMGDGSDNWIGNDRYRAYIRLREGATPQSIAPLIDEVVGRHHDPEMMRQAGIKLSYTFIPLLEVHNGRPEVKRTTAILSVLAFALIFTAALNYVLIIVSSLVGRSKEMAVNKCYGASGKKIYGKMLAETFADMTAGIVIAIFLIIAFRDTVQDLLGTSPGVMFNLRSALLLVVVCAVVTLVTGLIPGYMFSRVPVASAFRSYKENKRFWKLGLLFLQIVASGFLTILLVIIARQYNLMINDNPGYEYDNVAYCSLPGTDTSARERALDEIARLPEVAAVSSAESLLPFFGYPGNNVLLPGKSEELFNIADGEGVGDNFLSLFNISIVNGKSFTQGMEKSNEIMVNQYFADQITKLTGWTDGVIGKQVVVTYHSGSADNPILFTIVGVYQNYRIGFIGNEQNRPSAMFYSKAPGNILIFKYHNFTPELNAKVASILEKIFPEKDINVHSYAAEMKGQYVDTRRFRDSVLIGGAVTFIITIIGLIAYIRDEINRRRKETAIRKINGATLADVLRMFLHDISIIAVPALIIGSGISAYIALRWQAQFSEKISLSPLLFLTCTLVILLVIFAVVSLNCYKTANENPAIVVKSE